MTDGENLYAFVINSVQHAVDTVARAVEELADAFLAKGGLGSVGASLWKLPQALDGIAQSVEPFQRRAPSDPVEARSARFRYRTR
jgi:hypothetical protein